MIGGYQWIGKNGTLASRGEIRDSQHWNLNLKAISDVGMYELLVKSDKLVIGKYKLRAGNEYGILLLWKND